MMTANHEIRKFNAKTTAHHHKKLIKQDDVTYKTIQRSVIDNFFKTATAMKKCENCGAYSPAFRKDGFSKIFQKALPKRTQKIMRSMRKVLKVTRYEGEGRDVGCLIANVNVGCNWDNY